MKIAIDLSFVDNGEVIGTKPDAGSGAIKYLSVKFTNIILHYSATQFSLFSLLRVSFPLFLFIVGSTDCVADLIGTSCAYQELSSRIECHVSLKGPKRT